MVRIASLQHLIKQGDSNPDPSGLTPRQQLELSLSRVREIYDASYKLYCNKLVPALAKEGIHILDQCHHG